MLMLCLLFLLQKRAITQANYPFYFEKNLPAQFGADNILVIHRGIYEFQDKYLPDTLWLENTLTKKTLGFGYRMTKLFFLDFQEEYLISLVQHEVFGHGARLREFGSTNNNYSFSLFYPFGNGSGTAFPGTFPFQLNPIENITNTIGGVQANLILSTGLSERMLLSDEIHYRQALLYLTSKNNQLVYSLQDYIISISKGNGGNSGDMAGYTRKLNALYVNEQKEYTLGRLASQNLVSVINPLQVYAAFQLVFNFGIKGKKKLSHIPMFNLRKVRYLPLLDFNLTPYGGEYILSNNFRKERQLYVLNLGISDYYFNNSYRVEVKAFNFLKLKNWNFHGHAHLWNQPELDLESINVVFDANKKNVWGGSFKIDAIFNPLSNSNFGFYGQIGYKSKGFEMGTKLDQGLFLKYGLNFRF